MVRNTLQPGRCARTISSLRASTSSSDIAVESSTIASPAGRSGLSARFRSRWSGAQNASPPGSTPRSPRPVHARSRLPGENAGCPVPPGPRRGRSLPPRRETRPCQYRGLPSRPPPSAPSNRCAATIHSRTRGCTETFEAAGRHVGRHGCAATRPCRRAAHGCLRAWARAGCACCGTDRAVPPRRRGPCRDRSPCRPAHDTWHRSRGSGTRTGAPGARPGYFYPRPQARSIAITGFARLASLIGYSPPGRLRLVAP